MAAVEFGLLGPLRVVDDAVAVQIRAARHRVVDKSLVVHQRGGAGRWRLLETVRAFAAEQLGASGEQTETQERHLRWAAATAGALEGSLGGEWRDDFDAVVDDLRAVLSNAPPGPDAVPDRLARSLGHLSFASRFLAESVGHYRRAAEWAASPGEVARDLCSAADCCLDSISGGRPAGCT